jgi:excisionase family DNA binding protein
LYAKLGRVKLSKENIPMLKSSAMINDTQKNDITPRQMLTVNEVAHLLHVHPNTVRLWSKIGALKSYRIGRRRDYRFNLADVETFLYKDRENSE